MTLTPVNLIVIMYPMNATRTSDAVYGMLLAYVEETCACGMDLSVDDCRAWWEQDERLASVSDEDIELDLIHALEETQDCPDCDGEGGHSEDRYDWRAEDIYQVHIECETCSGSGTRYEDRQVIRSAQQVAA